MNELFSFALLSFTSFFTLINPLGTMPIFMTMTADLDKAHRTHTAKKAAIVALITIVIFSFSGELLFDFFGISVNSFRIVGGVIVLVMWLTYLILYSSSRILRLLGETGNNVLMRLMGLIVMVIAVEFFFSGLKPIVLDMME